MGANDLERKKQKKTGFDGCNQAAKAEEKNLHRKPAAEENSSIGYSIADLNFKMNRNYSL